MAAVVLFAGAAETVRLTNTFTVSGTATDPTTVSLTVTSPSGVVTTYTFAGGEVTKDSTGVYRRDIACTEAGIWRYVWTGTGTASDVQRGEWTVQAAAPRLYATVDELKSRLGLTDTIDDFELAIVIESSSRAVDQWCDRWFYRAEETRTYVPCNSRYLTVDDLVEVTSVKTDPAGDGTFETTWSTSDYQLLPYNASRRGESWPFDEIQAVGSQTFPAGWFSPGRADRVQIVGVFGWPAVPANVKEATLIIAADSFKAKDAPFGVAGYGEFGPMRVRDNPLATRLLKRYRRDAVLVG